MAAHSQRDHARLSIAADPTRTSTWRARLRRSEVERIEAVCGDSLSDFGYEPETLALRPSRLVELGGRMQAVALEGFVNPVRWRVEATRRHVEAEGWASLSRRLGWTGRRAL